MRKALAVVALAGACGGDDTPNNPMIDAAVDAPEVILPDAPSPVEGMWKDTYYTNNGAMTLNGCTSAPSAIKVDETSAMVTAYPGTCKADGSFKIDAPVILGTYYLKVNGALYETTNRTGLDLSTDRLGRSGVAAISGVTLSLTINNMESWATGDILTAFSPNIGYRQNLSFTSGAPGAGATNVGGVAAWSGYQVDSSKSDQLQVMQLAAHATGGGVDYLTLDRAFYAPAFTMSNNMQHTVTGSFTTPDPSSLALEIDVASFAQFASTVAPNVTTKSVQAVAFAAASTDVAESPPIFSFTQPADTSASVDFGTVATTDPFPAAWKRLVRVQVSHTAEYTYNGKTGTLTSNVGRVMTKGTAEAGAVTAQLGPVTNVKFDADDAMTDTMISPVPLLSWSVPTLGTATDYEVQVYEAVGSGSTLNFSSVLRLVTKSTSVRIPAGYLLGERQYVFVVRARNRENSDISTTPQRAGTQWSIAEQLTALVTTDS
jgi:hypothetical protein